MVKIFKLYLSLLLFAVLFIGKAIAQNQTVINGTVTTAVNFPNTGCLYTWINNTPGVGLAASGTGDIASFQAVNNGTTPITATITATPVTPGFGYITNTNDNTVTVFNTATYAKTIIPVGAGPYGVSVTADASRVYITNQISGTVSVINTTTNLVSATIIVGNKPTGIVANFDGTIVYVANTNDGTVSVINTASNTVAAVITVGSQPTGITASADGKRVYVTNYNDGTVSVINTASNTVVTSINAGANPTGIAISPDGNTLYVATGGNYVSAINIQSKTVIANMMIYFSGNSLPYGVAISPDGSRVYSADQGYDAMSVFITSIPAIYKSVSTPFRSPVGISVSPDGNKIYTVNHDENDVTVFDANTFASSTFNVGNNPHAFGNFIAKNTSCSAGSPVTFTITVNPTPTVATGAVTGKISSCSGSASVSPNLQQFTVSASGLATGITATAPSGFEISLNANSSYANNLILTQTGGVVNNTIYVRSAAIAPTGSITGNIVLASTGVQNQSIAVTGIIKALPTVNTLANQTVLNGAATTAINFSGTANTFTWVNNTPGIGLAVNGSGNIASFTAVNAGSTPLTATITATPVAAGMAYISNYDNSTVSVINTVTNKVVATVPVGSDPVGICASPDGSRVYVANPNDGTISVINTSTNTVITNIKTSLSPFGVAVSPDGGKLYVTAGTNNTTAIIVINTSNNGVISTIPIVAAGSYVHVSPDGSRLYVTMATPGQVCVINAVTNSVLTNITAGQGTTDLAINQDGTLVYATNFNSNNVSVINTTLNSVIATIPVGRNPTGIALSADGSKLYVANQTDGNLSIISTSVYSTLIKLKVGLYPTAVEISNDGSTLYVVNSDSNNVTIINTATNTVVATVPVGLDPVSYGSFITATGCQGTPTTFTITVNPTPNLSTAGILTAVNTTYGTASSSASFAVSANNLTSGVLVIPPSGFEVSLDNITFTNTVTIAAAGVISSAPVYIRLTSATAAGTYSGNVILSSAGVATTNIAMPASIVSPAPLPVTANDFSKTYGSQLNNAVGSTAFSIAPNALKNGNTITTLNLTYGAGAAATASVGKYPTIAPVINSTGNGFLSANYNITYNLGNIIVIPAPLTITANTVNKLNGTTLTAATSTAFTATGLQNQETIGSVLLTYGNGSASTDPTGLYAGSVTPSNPSGGTFTASNYTITYVNGDIIVEPPVAILVTGTLTALTTVYGTPSQAINFRVSGTNLTSGILVTPPPGFEVSTDNLIFHRTVTIGTNGNIAVTQVYIRLSGSSAVGNYSGNIVLGSAGISNTSLVVPTSTVNTVPLTILADNKTKVLGSNNPVLTVSYSGFVNSETTAVVSTLPTITTTAIKTSAVGQYVVMASGAVAPNYSINYVQGILTITPLPLSIVIPNTFTPNDDGINDFWNIPALAFYTNTKVSVYSRMGALVYYSVGYDKPWDGTFKGSKLPVATYYYVISVEMSKAINTFSGPISIIR